MEAKKLNNIIISEYLEIEKETQIKYEFHNNSIYALAGGTLNHGLICGNIFGELRVAFQKNNSSCKAMTSEIKLHIQTKDSFVYPDAMVICGQIQTSEVIPHAVTNPILIVEVLSKSTASYDRGDKFHLYRQIKSLQEYVLIEQDKSIIEIYKRESDLWKITRVEGKDKSVYFSSIGVKVKLEDIYKDARLEMD